MAATAACAEEARSAAELPGLIVDGLNICRTADGAAVVRDVSLQVGRGEILGVVGESGSGKTSLALALLGFAAPGLTMDAERICIGRRTLDLSSRDSIYEARRHAISYVPQDPTASLNPALSIRTQIHERLDAKRVDVTALVAEVMSSVDLPHDDRFLKRRVGTLSGGQQQRVAIAMAAVTKPDVLVLDEPTTGLDVTTQASVLSLVRRLCRETGMCGVFISHDLAVIRHVADNILVLYAGYDLEYGPAQAVTDTPSHPYSAALLRCVPDTLHSSELCGIPGRPPALEHPEPGCAFAPRCEFAIAACSAAVPARTLTAAGGTVRCVRYHERMLTSAKGETPKDGQATTGQQGHADPAPPPALEVHGLSAWYGTAQVLFDVNLRIARGQCAAIVGQSGSGKTTLSRCLIGLHPAYQGSIAFNGQSIPNKASHRSREERRCVQYIFQNPFGSLNPRLTVCASIRAPFSLYFGMRRNDAHHRVNELLERVGLPASTANLYPGQLSGGQQQRVAIARALAASPQLLLCDEITSALDVSVQASLLGLLKELLASGLSIVFVTHDLGVVRNIADRVSVLKSGRVVEDGETSQVIDNPRHEYTAALLNDTLSVAGPSTM